MLTHHVLFWLKDGITAEQKKSFSNALQSLEKIETVRSIYIGTPAPINRAVVDTSYTFSLLILFDDLNGHNSYQVHRLHQDFLDQNRIFFDKVVIYDAS